MEKVRCLFVTYIIKTCIYMETNERKYQYKIKQYFTHQVYYILLTNGISIYYKIEGN